jgi:XapX domain-containing protein
MNIRLLCGYLLAFSIGVLCRVSGIPLPSPHVLIGALVVVAMTSGYLFAERFFAKREASHREDCGGSLG